MSPLPRTVFPVVTGDNQLMYPSPSMSMSPAHGRSDAFGMPILVTPTDAADAFLSMPHHAASAAFSAKEKLSLETGMSTGEPAFGVTDFDADFAQFAVNRDFDSSFPDRESALLQAFRPCLMRLR